ncbi:MAG: FMN-binding negative transcriptional regulator [Ferruginibacter sp.]
MYDIGYFKTTEKEQILAFMRAHSFATVIGTEDNCIEASHLPLNISEQEEQIVFTGHLMRKTTHHLTFEKNNQVLVIFQSEPAYIHASWYENSAQASTVNYMAVHAKGTIRFGDEASTLDAIKHITATHLGNTGLGSYDQISEDYISVHVKAIVSFSIKVSALQHVFKLSQNKSQQDQKNIIAELEKRGESGDLFIAGEMKKII